MDFRDAEEAMHEWQTDWESWSEEAAAPARMRDAEAARIQHLVQAVAQLEERAKRLRAVPAMVPDPFSNHAKIAGRRRVR